MVDATTILLIVVTILTSVLVWSRRTYVYWQRRRVKFVQPKYFFGNLFEVLKRRASFALELRDFYFCERFAKEPVVGIYLFHQPALLLRDLQVIRQVLVEDFVNFSHRFAKCDAHSDKMGALNLFFARNPEWRVLRTKLSPVFTKAKMKQMFALMEEIGYDLETYLAKLTKDMKSDNNTQGPIVQIKDICDLYNTDMVASIAFGLKSYSLRNTMRSELCGHSLKLFDITFRRAIDLCLIFIVPKLVKFIRPCLFTSEHTDFLRRLVVSVLEDRERNGVMRNDLMELLLTFKMEADLNSDKSHFTHQQDYLVAQAATFQLAGIQTCSATLAFALYELALHPRIQERLHLEIKEYLDNDTSPFTYDRVEEMSYLSMVLDETLRKYPIVPFLERECTPLNRKRFVSFRPNADCMARRGMPVFISNLALHYDSEYWPDPYRFDPERFSPEQKKSHKLMSYLPFGAGPHHCIAQSLAQLQVKLGLIHFLRRHRVECCDKTAQSIQFDKRYALLTQEGGFYLRLVEI